MKIIKFFLVFVFTLISSLYSLASTAKAVCPVCTVAVGAGLGLSRFVGIDDTITGIWVGGMLVSLSFWTASYLEKKEIKLPQKSVISFILWSALILVPLQISGIIGHPFNTILGIDKLLFGSALGTAAFLIAIFADKKLRAIKGKQLFDFQRVVFPVAALLITSAIMFIITSVSISF